MYSKAIAAVVAALASILITFNVEISEEFQGAIIVIATTVAVWIAPKNAPDNRS